ncbi:MAG TPA: multicopper oxidase domain-containing protein, partial [Terriglobales bacterium]
PLLHGHHWHVSEHEAVDRGPEIHGREAGAEEMETVDMIPDDPGIWMYHCHFDEHMQAGMMARYKVEP